MPWVAVFDKEITKSAMRGYYVVYLFNSVGKGIYMSLNQGWTDYRDTYGGRTGRFLIRDTASYCRKIIRSSLVDFPDNIINLDANGTLALGYEAGHICGKFYPAGKVPDDKVLVNDLRNLVGVYEELKGLISQYNVPITRLLEVVENQEKEEEEEEEQQYQRKVEKAPPETIPPGPQVRPPIIRTIKGERYQTKPSIARRVVLDSDYICEFDKGHRTFTSRITSHNYVEAHHLVPTALQNRFRHSLDVPENIIALCPTCHRLFHHAISYEKDKLVQYFYGRRKEQLRERGIEITAAELIQAYG